MTNQDFLNGFYIQFDQVADFAAPGYTPLELSLIASKVQEDLALSIYNPKSNRLQEGFEETEKRIHDLGELVKYKSFTTFTAGFFKNSFEVIMPNTLITSGSTDFSDVYWLSVYEEGLTNVLDCTIPNNTTVYVQVNIDDISHGALSTALLDPFRRPYLKANTGRVLRVISNGRKHTLITDGTFTLTSYNVAYVKKPLPIDLVTNLNNTVSELSDQVHKQLLDMTVSYCMKISGKTEDYKLDVQVPKE